MSKVPIKYMIYTSAGFGARVYKDEQRKKNSAMQNWTFLAFLISLQLATGKNDWKKEKTNRLNIIRRADFEIMNVFCVFIPDLVLVQSAAKS